MSDNKSAQIIPLESRSAASQNTNSGSAQGVDDLYQGVIAGLPQKPKGLKKKESELWDEMGQKLADLGILSEIDLSVFHRYVISYVEWQHWNTECQKNKGLASIQVFASQVYDNALQNTSYHHGITPLALYYPRAIPPRRFSTIFFQK